ncbi:MULTISPECIES: BMP family lipoprotein [Haloferax]|jgi:basic membrane protein A|uniref:BMP family ABC transporter substrate-binding protein n=4 Tax=Haloferax TaxID=2251 RepID=A0A6C0UXG6_HALVO|nr:MULTISPECIES: BMP family protein [Haloferax]ELK52122.1 putative sugar ABC transporter periplasmic substrate-binding protein [Haloferax sp. BAB-2207]ELZ74674.1 putative sugar ABC transporter periplasmic substrate-binding protein [Haloferax lucentense DSM 14919]ELZ93950.1 putative sugar ABC transporter periplasmic substrate-binding protein [Haloferax alexandrinus JCM 10717]MBC9986166.1 BMP family ABC transporter substrate-binding protein [Haloferax sp. AS1]NLV02323.1 BMP family ABC transporte
MDRRSFVKAAGVAGIAGLAGCTGGPSEGSEETTTAEQTTEESGGEETTAAEQTTEESGPAANVGMVYALGGLGDKSFNDAAKRGIEQAESELGIAYDEAQPSAAEEFPQFQRRFAQSSNPDYDLVSCIGYAQRSALSETAPSFSDQQFMIVDDVVDEDNVASYLFREEQGSFQVGYLAGLITTQEFSAGSGSTTADSKSVGFVGGTETDLIRKFQAGYEAGVAHADEEISVDVAYVGSFSDSAKGKEIATSMYDNGADVVYHAAGGSGLGVFQAAKEQGKFAIGVDSDQSQTEPNYADVILASMVKRVESAVYTSVENVVNDEFNGGSTTTLGLEEDGVAAVYGAELGSEIPQDVKDSLSESREAIIAGDIEIPTTTE